MSLVFCLILHADSKLSFRIFLHEYLFYVLKQFHHYLNSQSYITTDGQSANLSWNKAPIWGLRPDLDYCLTVVGLLVWGVLSDERTGLPFAIATGPRQRSHFRFRVP
jgi:uncharacterized membrane protein